MPKIKLSTPAQRQLIQVGRRKAGWDHDTHVAFMQARWKKGSTLDLTYNQAEEYKTHLRALGHIGYGRKNSEARPAPAKETLTQEEYIQILWKQLSDAGKLNDSSDYALQCFVKRVTGVNHVTWCNQTQKSNIITALKRWKES